MKIKKISLSEQLKINQLCQQKKIIKINFGDHHQYKKELMKRQESSRIITKKKSKMKKNQINVLLFNKRKSIRERVVCG